MSGSTVSVLIPMWNEERYIAGALDSLLAQDFDGRLEIVIADGASNDRSVEIVEEYMRRTDDIVLVDNPARNTAVGRNRCLQASSGEIVVSFMAHAVAPESFVSTLARKLREAPEEVAAVGASNVAPEGDALSGRIIGVINASLLGGARSVDQNARYASEREVDSMALVAYRAEVVKRLGGYDETLWVGEDAELNYRLGKAGFKILYTPETVGYRFNRGSLWTFWRQMFRYGIARSLILRKHPDSLRPTYLLPGLFSTYVVLGLIASLAAPAWLPWYGGSLALYVALGWTSSLLVSRDPALVALSPAYYFAMHFGYGAGLFKGALARKVW